LQDAGIMQRLAMSGILVALLSVTGLAAAPKPPAPAQKLPAPAHVSAQTRHEVKARMGQHATTMQNLVRAVVLLDRPTIRVLATRIADEEVVARTGSIREGQRPSLPPKFFAEQDELAATARQLAAAAVDGGDDAALADRFAALTRTCVGCHSAYLRDRPDPLPAPSPR
jgi:hypothetical protein